MDNTNERVIRYFSVKRTKESSVKTVNNMCANLALKLNVSVSADIEFWAYNVQKNYALDGQKIVYRFYVEDLKICTRFNKIFKSFGSTERHPWKEFQAIYFELMQSTT